MDIARLVVWAAILAAVVAVGWFINSAFDNHYAGPVRAEMARMKQSYDDTIAVNEKTIATLQRSVADTEQKVLSCNANVDALDAASKSAEADANRAIAEAKAKAKASAAREAELRAQASGPPTKGLFAEQAKAADKILTEYAVDVDAALKALGLR